MANKPKRIEMVIKKNICDILQFEIKNDNIGFVTVTDCKMSQDYQHVRVYVTFFNAKNPNNNLEALNKVKGYVRTSLSKKMNIWKVPAIEFLIDDSYELGIHMSEVLAKDQKEIDAMKNNKNK